MIKLEPGMRVRCVDDCGSVSLVAGETYTIAAVDPLCRFIGLVGGRNNGRPSWFVERFKPVVRVKAPCVRVPKQPTTLVRQ
jgi:hypothetical protein